MSLNEETSIKEKSKIARFIIIRRDSEGIELCTSNVIKCEKCEKDEYRLDTIRAFSDNDDQFYTCNSFVRNEFDNLI